RHARRRPGLRGGSRDRRLRPGRRRPLPGPFRPGGSACRRAAPGARAPEPPDEAKVRQVREAFEAARIDDDAIGDAICVVETYLAAHPDHLVATAYLGSLHAMCAGAAHLPWIKLKHAAIASRLLDGAHERWRGGAHRGSGETYAGELEIL